MLCGREPIGFPAGVSRFLNLGDGSEQSRLLLNELVAAAPAVIDDRTPHRRRNPGLRSEHFANFPIGVGYYSWLFQLMYSSEREHDIHIGRFEDLKEEVLRLFETTRTPITNRVTQYLEDNQILNSSLPPSIYNDRYTPELLQLVADKEQYITDTFGYDASMAKYPDKYSKTEFFRDLGTADVSALNERVKNVPFSVWEEENEGKLNKFKRLNTTRHIVFRFVDVYSNVYDYQEYASWKEWEDVLLPLMEQAAQALGYTEYCFPRVMFAQMPAGGEISPHADLNASHYVHKIHIPLTTNPRTMFQVGNQKRHLEVGEIMEVNNKRMHAVYNDGPGDRIHFIFECCNLEDYGKPD